MGYLEFCENLIFSDVKVGGKNFAFVFENGKCRIKEVKSYFKTFLQAFLVVFIPSKFQIFKKYSIAVNESIGPESVL